MAQLIFESRRLIKLSEELEERSRVLSEKIYTLRKRQFGMSSKAPAADAGQ